MDNFHTVIYITTELVISTIQQTKIVEHTNLIVRKKLLKNYSNKRVY